jgi:hypothetical protein
MAKLAPAGVEDQKSRGKPLRGEGSADPVSIPNVTKKASTSAFGDSVGREATKRLSELNGSAVGPEPVD